MGKVSSVPLAKATAAFGHSGKKIVDDVASQSDCFIETARQLGADGDEAAFKEKLATIARQRPKAAHASDCAMHNAPAYEPGPCTCGAAKAER